MKISQTIAFTGLAGLLLAGLLAPTIYATEDGQFPAFPTIVGDGSGSSGASSTATGATGETVISPATPTEAQKATVIKTKTVTTEDRDAEERNNFVTNESGVFSPWGTIKQAFVGRAQAGEEGVVFALEALDAKPSGQGDLRYQISYANNTDETLRNVSVQVFLPKELQYLDSDLQPDSKGNGSVVYEIGKIAAGEEGAIQLETRLKKKKAKEAVLSATMAYENIDGDKHTVTASANNAFNGKNGGLTASVADGVGGVMLWLFVIVLLVALVFVGYQYSTLRASGRRA